MLTHYDCCLLFMQNKEREVLLVGQPRDSGRLGAHLSPEPVSPEAAWLSGLSTQTGSPVANFVSKLLRNKILHVVITIMFKKSRIYVLEN